MSRSALSRTVEILGTEIRDLAATRRVFTRGLEHGTYPSKQLRTARVISTGHAFVQNLRRGHYELDVDPGHRLPATFAELALAI
jgi:hypothetical protein